MCPGREMEAQELKIPVSLCSKTEKMWRQEGKHVGLVSELRAGDFRLKWSRCGRRVGSCCPLVDLWGNTC